MKVETIGYRIVIDRTTMTSLGKEVPAAICYDDDPDNGHGHYSTCNLEHYTIEEKEVPDVEVFRAYVKRYSNKPGWAYEKLKEIGMIK